MASLVLEHGGSETQAIAALLHDALEDRPRDATTWHIRKKTYIAHVASMPRDAVLVSLADKLDNARKILADLREIGEPLWQRFKGGKDGTIWYYRELANAFGAVVPGNVLAEELERTVAEMERQAE